ncbi:YdbC family protein [Actinoplanes awajinensis]|uniref:DUF4937 domain-containing protein n=1 Tax=Actinoplanes awajinensis subsp. mycoplanecinus TaxID=135947 RepID=A0A101JR93_9ACTN|nr:YdbC family protein [Actinoplanes awajinensis]KUL31218.1 hypothetical protein ADL15_22440 [Actinoplanes awajinensis subsp. mycoplanecinus]
MLLKWVICEVGDATRFTAGQSGWGSLRRWPGFLGQAGGWSTRVPGRAHILGCWRDRADYGAFMAAGHDRIAAGQAGSYHGIEVRLCDDARSVGRSIPEAFAAAEVVRLAHGPAHEHTAYFVRNEQSTPDDRLVWRSADPDPSGPGDDMFALVPEWTVVPRTD